MIPTTGKIRKDLPPFLMERLKSIKSITAFDPSFEFHPGLTVKVPGERNHYGGEFRHITKLPKIYTKEGAETAKGIASVTEIDDPVKALEGKTPLSAAEIRSLYRFPLVVRRVVNMTGKGKIPSMSVLIVVGNGRGLVGFGEGKDSTLSKAVDKAFVQAVKSLDYVRRFQDRTVSGTMRSNFGSTKIEMRPRPPGTFPFFSCESQSDSC